MQTKLQHDSDSCKISLIVGVYYNVFKY